MAAKKGKLIKDDLLEQENSDFAESYNLLIVIKKSSTIQFKFFVKSLFYVIKKMKKSKCIF